MRRRPARRASFPSGHSSARSRHRAAPPSRLVVGLTGGYGSGKSTVLSMFRALGAAVADADSFAREALAPRRPAHRRVVRVFGPGVLGPGGALDRAKLAARVFNDPAARRRLERIVHPFVIAGLKRAIRRHTRGVLVLEIPLLFEAGLARLADRVAVVRAPQRLRRRRLAARGVGGADFLRRSRAQWPLRRKIAAADDVIDNGGGLAATRRRVRALLGAWGFPARG